MQIKEYRTVAEVSLETLDGAVNDLINAGFQPYGNPYTISNVKGRKEPFVACQAMVRVSEALAENPPGAENPPEGENLPEGENPSETSGADFTVG